MQNDRVPDAEALQLRPNLRRVADLAADEVLEAFVGVEAAASLTELDEPGPNGRGRSVDRDRVVIPPVGLEHQLVTRQSQGPLFLGGAPPSPPFAQERVEQEVGGDLRGAGDRFDQLAQRGALRT